MKTIHKMTSITAAALAAGASLLFLPSVQADTLTFTNASASSVAAAMSKRYGVTIVFRGSLNTSRPVTFSVDNPDTPDGRLEAVSSLASALDLDYQKVYVVSKTDPGTAIPPVLLDNNEPIVFPSTHVSAREAIQTVAAVDNALTQISSLVTGDVTLPGTHMNAADAAAVIAKQTGTQWKAYYGLFRRGDAPERLAGAVIGRTNAGQPITELPLLTYRSSAPIMVPLHSGEDAVVGPLDAASMTPNIGTVPNTNFGLPTDDSLDAYGYGDPYGYTNPYAPYGYTAPDGTFASPGSVYTPGAGVSPAVPGVNAPGVNAAPGPNGTAVVPGGQDMGNGGGQVPGGY
jgi:hypothetical protein